MPALRPLGTEGRLFLLAGDFDFLRQKRVCPVLKTETKFTKGNPEMIANAIATVANIAHTKFIAASLSLAVAGTGVLGIVAPTTAYANDGSEAYGLTQQEFKASKAAESHYEGEAVTIGSDWGHPIYAEWHRGDSGKWWATFWTYNYTKVYAEPSDAGCGWSFHAFDKDGNFVTIYRCEESINHGIKGPQGISSHWSNAKGTLWF